ncbi:uncharacterized protein EI90DRAFT_1771427 [Cantharellus anzutake]|uniref:uncharacterized protein n=1 Tax=Cantharellus anzutake TaxID=1750568 RepID=UPI00190776C4|nr:uncharacterized protein EI90DRAFT_1771427 [Cantharellus anzutake]KAF8327602.1 hypothetical protein EI90DRAFT_1771427 [Cantharellus anzutake]
MTRRRLTLSDLVVFSVLSLHRRSPRIFSSHLILRSSTFPLLRRSVLFLCIRRRTTPKVHFLFYIRVTTIPPFQVLVVSTHKGHIINDCALSHCMQRIARFPYDWTLAFGFSLPMCNTYSRSLLLPFPFNFFVASGWVLRFSAVFLSSPLPFNPTFFFFF